jgi:hypothetical protein
MMGFCGEYLPKEPGYPGRFYGSWGFEDRGRLYVDDDWDDCYKDGDRSSSALTEFRTGDTVFCSVDPRSNDTYYRKRGGAKFIPQGEGQYETE